MVTKLQSLDRPRKGMWSPQGLTIQLCPLAMDSGLQLKLGQTPKKPVSRKVSTFKLNHSNRLNSGEWGQLVKAFPWAGKDLGSEGALLSRSFLRADFLKRPMFS